MRLAVAVGGAVGSLARVAVDLALPTGRFPVATLLVNVTGAFALAWLLGRGADERVRAGIGTGFLGAWTTFSALVVQTDRLLLTDPPFAVTYLVATFALGLVAVVVGARLGTAARVQPPGPPGPPGTGATT